MRHHGIARLGHGLGAAAFLLQAVLLLLQPGALVAGPVAAHHHDHGVPDEHDHAGDHGPAHSWDCRLSQAFKLAGHPLGGSLPAIVVLTASRPAVGWASVLVPGAPFHLPVQPRAPPSVA